VTDQRRPYAGARVVLGVTGGIASYKSAWLARLLTKAGAQVDVVMTSAAREFIGAITFEALTGRPVHTNIFDEGRALEHVKLGRDSDVIVVAPATADFLARAATGQAPDLLGAILLAAKAPVMLVPAMNDQMWAHGQTRANVARLRELGYQILDPDTGELAAGEGSGPGRMPEPEIIFAHLGRVLEKRRSLDGLHVLVTAGPTREAVDPVRFISNRSSGKMGIAVAEAAWRRGASVTLVAGPLEIPIPPGVKVERVETTAEMSDAVGRLLPESDVLVMAAAPADFRPVTASTDKIKRAAGSRAIELESTADILASTRNRRKADATVVGFALETRELIQNAEKKLAEKGLDMVVANDALEPGAGFSGDTNRVTMIFPNGTRETLALMPKTAVADEILDRVEKIRHGR
jgi:phosphopantothenoylcysteine decarboxylase / phosphopantothenate---cysteine ligase